MIDVTPNCRIVNFETDDGLRVDGLLAYAGGETTVIHVHGKCGNFYANDFLTTMADRYPDHNINFLSFNNRGHDCLAEAYQDGELTYVGGSVERFEESVEDIQAAVDYAASFSERVVLQGHSNGCEKVLYYDMEADDPLDAILLSPSDSYELHARFLFPESVTDQHRRLKAMESSSARWTWLPEDEYGINVNDKEYSIPVTRESLLDLHEGPGLRVLRYGEPWPFDQIDVNLLACVGGEDPYVTVSPTKLRAELRKRSSGVTLHRVPDADHHFHDCEQALLDGIVDWLGSKTTESSPNSR